MKRFYALDPVYRDRFSGVWLWSEWAAMRPGFDATDTGIDLVAEELEGGTAPSSVSAMRRAHGWRRGISTHSSPRLPAIRLRRAL